MDRAERIKNNCFYVIVGGVFTFAISGAVLVSTYIELDSASIFLASFLLVAAFCLFFYNKYTFAVTSGVLMLGMLGVLAYLWHMDFNVEWFLSLSDWAQEAMGHIQGMSPYREEYSVLGYAVVFVFAGFTAAFIRTSISFYFMSLLGFSVIGVLSYLGYLLPGIYPVSVLLAAACLLTLKMARSASRRGEDGEGEPVYSLSTSGLLLIPLCAAIMIAAALVPRPEMTTGANIRANIEGNLYRLNEYMLDRFGPKYFTFSSTGFSPVGGRLGGNITPNDRKVMDVFLDGKYKPYLSGAYRDTYTGDRWTVSGSGVTEADSLGQIESASKQRAMWFYLGDLGYEMLLEFFFPALKGEVLEYTKRELLTMEHAYLSAKAVIQPARPTTTVFAPGGRIAFRHSDSAFDASRPLEQSDISASGAVYIDAVGSLSTQKAMERGTSYTVEYIESASGDDSAFREQQNAYFMQYPLDLSDERLAQYLTLPDSLPQRVRDLAEHITKDARNPYEKMKALEEYLMQYPYTLSPGQLPAGEDFVDWFLFEGREGYCTYYATALAVMGRCVGVPTRYAEGFTLPAKPNSDGIYEVTNAQAHAWVDAFFPHSGWTTFEATAPYNYPFYHGGETPTLAAPVNPEYVPGNEELDDFIDEFNSGLSQTTSPSGAGGEEAAGETNGINTAVLIISVVLVLAAAVSLRYYIYRRGIARIETASPRDAAIAYFTRIAGVLASNGVAIEPHETAHAFARRVDTGRGIGAEGFTMEHMADIFSRARYSVDNISQSECDTMARCYGALTSRPGAPASERAAAWIERYILFKY